VNDLDDSSQPVSFFPHLKTSLASKVEGISKCPQLLYQEEQVQTGVNDEGPSPFPPLNDPHPTTKTKMEDERRLPESAQIPKVPKKVRFDALVESRLLESLVLEIELAQSSESSYRSATYDEDEHFGRQDERRLPESTQLPKVPKKVRFDALVEARLLEALVLEIELAQSSESSYRSATYDEDEHFGRYLGACSSQDSDLAIAGWSFSQPTVTSDDERRIYSYRRTNLAKTPGMQEFLKNPMTNIPQTQSHICRPSDNMPFAEQSSNALNRRLDTRRPRYQNARATMTSEPTTGISKRPVKTSKMKPTSTITPSANKFRRRMERMRIKQVKKQQNVTYAAPEYYTTEPPPEPIKTDAVTSDDLEGNIENQLKYLSPQPLLAAQSNTEEDDHFGRSLITCSSQDTELAIAGWSFSQPALTSDEESRIYSHRSTNVLAKKTPSMHHRCRPSKNMPLTEQSSNATKPTSTITRSANKLLRRMERMVRTMQVQKQRRVVSG
jgi:hypothetical protein